MQGLVASGNVHNELRREKDLDAAVLLVAERLVGVRRFLQGKPMGDDERWIDLVFLDSLQQRRKVVLGVSLPHFKGQAFSEGSSYRHLIEKAEIDPGSER
jgi:hypothetical protein